MFDKVLFKCAVMQKKERMIDAARVIKVSECTLFRKIRKGGDFSRDEIQAFCKHYEVNPEPIFFSGKTFVNAKKRT